jgi:hypothetical protein
MLEKAERLRARARQCRSVAELARDRASRRLLLQIADELEADAATIEAETADPQLKKSGPADPGGRDEPLSM